MKRIIVFIILVSLLVSFIPIPKVSAVYSLTLIDTVNDGGNYYKTYFDGSYYYTAQGGSGLTVYQWSGINLVHLKNDNSLHPALYNAVTGDPASRNNSIYVSLSTDGITDYVYDSGLNTLTPYCTLNTTGNNYLQAFVDENEFIHVANGTGGLACFTCDDSAFYDVCTATPSGTTTSVWETNISGSDYVFIGNADSSLKCYYFDGSSYTFEDSITNGTTAIHAVWGDDVGGTTYVFTAHDTDGVYVYSFDGTFHYLAHIDDAPSSAYDIKDDYDGIPGDPIHIFVSWDTDGLRMYSFDTSTNSLTYLTSQYDGNIYFGTWLQLPLIFESCNTAGERVYQLSGTGSLLAVTTNPSPGQGINNATLSGTLVNDSGFQASVGFQYGTTNAYGNWYNISQPSIVVYHNQSEYQPNHISFSTPTNYFEGQTFTIGNDGSNETLPLYNISFYGFQQSGMNGSINVSINATNASGFPTYAIANASFVFTTGDQWVTTNLTPTANVSKGVKYAIVYQAGMSDSSHNAYFYYSNSNPYSGGNKITCPAGTWSNSSSADIAFFLYFNNTLVPHYISPGDTFTYDKHSLTGGTFYHYKATVNNTNGDFANGSDVTFLTKPYPPFNTVSTNSSVSKTINISWDADSLSNKTLILRKTTGYPASITDGTVVYNGSAPFYNDSVPSPGITYWYSLWHYVGNATLFQFSDNYGFTHQFIIYTVSPTVTTNTSTSTTISSSILNGYLTSDGGEPSNCRFQYGTDLTYGTTTANQLLSTGNTFSQLVNGLSKGTYYCYRAQANNSNGTANGTNFNLLTLPDVPIGFHTLNITGTSMTLDWSNDSFGTGVNQSTVIRYKTTGYPSSLTDGTFLASIPSTQQSDYTISSGLSPGTTYYFSAWTQVNISSLGLFQNSSNYATTSGKTQGGIYNISIFYENLSIVNDAVALNKSSVYLRTRTGQILNSTYGLTYYSFNMTSNQTVDVIYLYFNGSTYYRATVPDSNNVKMYVSNRSENVYAAPINYSNYQLLYIFSFTDKTVTQKYVNSPDTTFFIYLMNGSVAYKVHENFLSAEKTVACTLDFGKTYLCGVKNNQGFIPFISYFTPGTSTSIVITINPETGNQSYNINDLAFFTIENDSTGLLINYTDLSSATNSATIWIYSVTTVTGNGTILNGTGFITPIFNFTFYSSIYNYHWTAGVNLQQMYYIVIEINNSLFLENQTINGMYYPIPSITHFVSENVFDTFMIKIAGVCPFYPWVDWASLLSFVIFFICLLSLNRVNEEVAVIFACSMFLIFQVVLFSSPIVAIVDVVLVATFLIGLAFANFIKKERGIA